MTNPDTALDALLTAADAAVLDTVSANLNTGRGAALAHWHAVPNDDVPLPSHADIYAAYRDIHIDGTIATSAMWPDGTAFPEASAQPPTFTELLAAAHRDTTVLAQLLSVPQVSGDTGLLVDQLEVRLGFFHNRLVPCGPYTGQGLTGTAAAHFTLAVWGSARRIRRRLGQGQDAALPPAAALQAISLCTSIIDAMETIRDTLSARFGIGATAAMT
ncbi:hypothetical protein ABZ370_40500 [Streptomyces sp. NPDC005962]|uniref:hypothetical protein n=1 Tax=Streptomyces sp. NPDC005962 TaxID=3154466 RepID=UPI0033F5B730